MIHQPMISEESMPYFGIRGKASLREGNSTAGFPGRQSNTALIQTDQEVNIDFNWKTDGLLLPFLCGQWKCEMFLEQMGEKEFGLPRGLSSVTTPVIKTNPATYNVSLNIPANTIPDGIYRIVVRLLFEAKDGTPAPIAAFAEFGLVQFYRG